MSPRPWQILAPLICGTLVSCATAAQKESAQAVWSECVKINVEKLDDGKSDPTSIAAGVAPLCASEYNQITQMMVSENITDVGQANARRQMAGNEIRLITSAVLTRRANKR